VWRQEENRGRKWWWEGKGAGGRKREKGGEKGEGSRGQEERGGRDTQGGRKIGEKMLRGQ